MNKTAIKNFAVWARQKLIDDIKYKAGMLGITENGIAEKLPQSTKDLQFFDIGTKNYAEVSGKEISQRNALIYAIKHKETEGNKFKEAFKYVVEEVAYTWFNRLIAIRFMEVNDYLPSGIRVLSSENKAKNEPDFVTSPFDTDLEFTPYEQDRVVQLKDENKLDELFRMLFIKQCNKLHDILPELFEKTDDYTELLLTISFTDKDGIVYRLTHDIDEDNFNIDKEGQVEIIGWMYQYYNIEPKAEVFGRKSGTKMSKEDIPAATQLFTPDWIVRYMVENSVGRIWIEGHPNDSLKNSWNYYVDEAEQEQQVVAKLEEIKATYKELSPEKIKVIDPCMGSGHILVYAFDVLMQIYESYGYTQRDAARSILQNNIFGLDIDERAYQLAYFAVMMKARQYNRRILSENIEPNLCYLKNSKTIEQSVLDRLGELKKTASILIDENRYAEEYGSVLNISVPYSDLLALEEKLEELSNKDDYINLMDVMEKEQLVSILSPIVQQSKILAQKYEVAVTNPPYMPVSNAGAKLSDYIKANYLDSKTDLFAVFIERCKQMLVKNGYQAMITMHAWMFLSSYEKLREKMLMNDAINMAHLGARAFEEIGGEVVQTTAFVLRNSTSIGYKGTYCRLVDALSQYAKEELFLSKRNRYNVNQKNFSRIPSCPFAYWVTDNFFRVFENGELISKNATPKQGMSTCDVNRFVKLWSEVDITKSNLFNTKNHNKWVRYNKGGEYRRWYGNRDYVVLWNEDGNLLKANKAALRNQDSYFDEFIAWTKISSTLTGFRNFESDFLFDGAGGSLFLNDNKEKNYYLGFLNSKPCSAILNIISPTLNFNESHIGSLPLIKNREYFTKVSELAEDNIVLSKKDWDSFENSWDFTEHPLVRLSKGLWDATAVGATMHYYYGGHPKVGSPLELCYMLWQGECNERFKKLKANEEELNRIFIDIYGLQDELTPEVEDKDVTVRKADLQRDIKSLISYAVGCMFGRYSLDREGIVFAGGNFDEVYWKYKGQAALDENGEPIDGGYAGISLADYHYPKFHDTDNWETATELSFEPDADNCIPITDEEYFEDDIVGLFCAWLKKVYGEDSLEQNLDFIAKALGNKGATSREVIRNYFLNDFIKDHIKTYQKRPIYWLFDSGKQNGFKALCYMHRWNADTTGNMRVEYLHRMQRVYEKEIIRMQEIIDNSRDNKEISNATKRKEKLQKQIKETKDYDAKVAHLALSRIDIDLDDGVKVNYEKVQTASDGKKMQILAKI